MSKRLLSIIALTAFLASQCTAAGLFSSRKRTPRSSNPDRIPLSVLRSPEKMTERFGPSVLIDEPTEKIEKSRKFVTQPD